MFSKSPQAVIYFTKNNLQIYTSDPTSPHVIDFPARSITQMKAKDETALKDLVSKYLTDHAVEHNLAILVLAEDILMKKVIPVSSEGDEKKDTEKFFKTIPLDLAKIAKKILRSGDEMYLLATNKELFRPILEALKSQKWEVEQVIPVSLFDSLENDDSFTVQEVEQILGNHKSTKIGNFLEPDQEEAIPSEEKEAVKDASVSKTEVVKEDKSEKKQKKEEIEQATQASVSPIVTAATQGGAFLNPKTVLLLAGISIATAVAVFFALKFGYGLFGGVQQSLTGGQEEMLPSSTPIPSPTPTVTAVDKSSIAVQVLNGTGTAGQAGRVKTALEELGFTEVETGNATDKENVTTIVQFAKNIDETTKDEVVAALKETFSTVETASIEADSKFQIVVTTGEEK